MLQQSAGAVRAAAGTPHRHPGTSACKEASWSQKCIINDEPFDFFHFLKNTRELTDLLHFPLIKQGSESAPGAKGRFREPHL